MDILYQFYLKLFEQNGIDGGLAMISWYALFFALALVALIFVSLLLLFFEKKVVNYFVPEKVLPKEKKTYVELAVNVLQHLRPGNFVIKADNAFLYCFAPAFMFTTVILMWGLLPYSNKYIPIPSNISLVLFLALVPMYSLAMFMNNISSNNKFAYVAAIRASALSLVCLLPMLLEGFATAVIPGYLSLNDIVLNQSSSAGAVGWYVVSQVVGFFVFIASVVLLNLGLEAEFSLGEAENIYGTRYVLLMLSRYGFMFAISAFAVCLFFGGYLPVLGKYIGDVVQVHYVFDNSIVYFEQIIWFFAKALLLTCGLIWLKVMCAQVSTKKIMQAVLCFLLPLAILNFAVTFVIKYAGIGG